ncbi:hypothetical protein [Olivibacter sp. XZL3]|uniref:hypothetical protein n=1 Tax=Olivibacter sp. XZL3 TaxID=1735116 RepID=UPI00106512BF|nr:hypothetical protein [Olivibacter sp. XZL3]
MVLSISLEVFILGAIHCYESSIDWDKVPNWMQAIGAIIASIGLVYTLLLQRRTLKEQQKITRIEQENFLKGHLPLLELSNVTYTKSGQGRSVKFKISIKNNPLQKLTVQHNFPEDYKIDIPYIISDVILPVNYQFEFGITYALADVFIEVVEYTGNSLVFLFEDALGNRYQQLLVYKGSDLVFLHPATRMLQ